MSSSSVAAAAAQEAQFWGECLFRVCMRMRQLHLTRDREADAYVPTQVPDSPVQNSFPLDCQTVTGTNLHFVATEMWVSGHIVQLQFPLALAILCP